MAAENKIKKVKVGSSIRCDQFVRNQTIDLPRLERFDNVLVVKNRRTQVICGTPSPQDPGKSND